MRSQVIRPAGPVETYCAVHAQCGNAHQAETERSCAVERAYGWCWHTDRQHAEPMLESDRRPVPMYAAQGDPVLSPVWRRRAIDPDGEGVSLRFRFAGVDLTSRMVVR